MLSNRQKLQLKYKPLQCDTKIAPIEHIIASKLTRRNPDKDIPDIANLLKLYDVRLNKVYEILTRKQKEEPDYNLSKIISILRRGKNAFEEYLNRILSKI